jgi:hypothetical protein
MKGVPASGVRKSPREWLITENAIVTRLFNAGAQLPEMCSALPRHTDSQIRRHLHHLKLKREAPLRLRNSWVWSAMQAAIREHGPLTLAELEEKTKANHAGVLRQLNRYHGDGLYVTEWRPTSRKPAAVWALGDKPDADKRSVLTRQKAVRRTKVNPFAAAAGLVEAPKGNPGRVFIHLTDSKDDEYAEAA